MNIERIGTTSIVEQVSKTLQFSSPAPNSLGKLGYTATGETETATYEGTWPELETYARKDALTASGTVQKSYSISRKEGDQATLTITTTKYTQDEEESGGADDPEYGDVGSSRDNPVYNYQFNTIETSILLSPIVQEAVKGLSADDPALAALHDYANGASLKSPMGNGGKTIARTLYEAGILDKVIGLPLSYLDFDITLTATYKTSAKSKMAKLDGLKIVNPPGPLATSVTYKDRNWLFIGRSAQVSGNEISVTEIYKLSMPGGWSELIYGSK